jgi:hypothetical protein
LEQKVRETIEPSSKLSNFVRSVIGSLAMKSRAEEIGHPLSPPPERTPHLMQIKADFDAAVLPLITFIESWKIVDPKKELFRKHLGHTHN